MERKNQSSRTNIPDLSQGGHPLVEKTTLTPQEEQVFNQMIEEMLPGSAEETQQFLDHHRQEAQGQ